MMFVQWTWAATILQSSNVAWEYGVSGPFWYASGATIQARHEPYMIFPQNKAIFLLNFHILKYGKGSKAESL